MTIYICPVNVWKSVVNPLIFYHRSGSSGPKNPYRVLLAGESVAKEDQSVSVKRLPSPSQDKDIKTVTKQFCDWVVSLVCTANMNS